MSMIDRTRISNRLAKLKAKMKEYAEELEFWERLYYLATKGQKKLGEEEGNEP